MNGKPKFFLFLFIFIAGIVLGIVLANLGGRFFRRGGGDSADLRERFEQVNRDLKSAIDSQREAERRAARLQTELQGIAEQARSIEEGTRRAEERAGGIAAQLDGAITQSGELTDGINRASDSLEDSRVLLDELGTILRGLQ
jgi:chromosome segregation ATPase